MIAGLVILTINSILNILKKRSGHFIFGMLLVIWIFIAISLLGLIWRDMRKRQFNTINGRGKCASLLDSLHSEDIKDACPSKYMN